MFNICIVYSAGSYGTFVEWCLNYFSNPFFPQDLPFLTQGNSHKFAGNHLSIIEGVKAFVADGTGLKKKVLCGFIQKMPPMTS